MTAPEPPRNAIQLGDNLDVLRSLPDGAADLIYVDPPFNTGRERKYTRLRAEQSDDGDRTGFGDKIYSTSTLSVRTYADAFDDYLGWLEPRMLEAHRVLSASGTLYFHIDYREVHYCKIMLDAIFGRECFVNEIIWAYDFGGRPRRRWPAKHDNILMYVRDPNNYTFNVDDVERIPYMAPGLVGPEKAARGKLPTDTWWHTIVPTSGSERTGYPTQKPLGVLKRIVTASSKTGDLVLDFCAGSGTTGIAAASLGRRFHLIDDNPEALAVMAGRFADIPDVSWIGYDPGSEQQSTIG